MKTNPPVGSYVVVQPSYESCLYYSIKLTNDYEDFKKLIDNKVKCLVLSHDGDGIRINVGVINGRNIAGGWFIKKQDVEPARKKIVVIKQKREEQKQDG